MGTHETIHASAAAIHTLGDPNAVIASDEERRHAEALWRTIREAYLSRPRPADYWCITAD